MEARNKVKSKSIIDRLAGDKVVWIIVLMLCLVSLVAIFSSTSSMVSTEMSRIDIIISQIKTIVGGLILVFLIYKINRLSIFKLFSALGFAVSLGVLLFIDTHASLGPFKARAIHGAWRVIQYGGDNGFQIHVFEIVKVAMVMYIAWAMDYFRRGGFKWQRKLAERYENLSFLKSDLAIKAVNIYLPIVIICVASLPGGNSNMMFITLVMFATVVISGIPKKDFLFLGAVAVAAVFSCVVIYKVTDGEKFARLGTLFSGSRTGKDKNVQGFIDAKKGTIDYYKYLDKIRQTEGEKIAIKRGGFFGKGPGNSLLKYSVPIIYEDYIFSFFIEEYGLLGGILLIVLYISLLARGSLIARNCDDDFAKIAVGGLCVMIAGQAMMHILVNCDMGLRTGQTLPLISHGTSSFICFSIAFGVILSISRMARKKMEKEAAQADPLISFHEDPLKGSLDDLNSYESGDNFNPTDI